MTALQVTFYKGKPLAAYLAMPRKPGDTSVRCEEAEAGLVIDFAADGRPIGIEITSPTRFSLAALNRVLSSLHLAPVTPNDVAPLAS